MRNEMRYAYLVTVFFSHTLVSTGCMRGRIFERRMPAFCGFTEALCYAGFAGEGETWYPS